MNIVLNLTRKGSENAGQGTSLRIELKNDVTLTQARNLAKLLKLRATANLNITIHTDEEVIQIK